MELFLVVAGIGAVLWFFNSKPRQRSPQSIPRADPGSVPAPPSPPPRTTNPAPAPPPVTSKVPPRILPKSAVKQRSARPFEFCALDTETTGIVPKSRRHRAFEISCVRFTPSGENTWSKKRFTRYVKVDVREMKGLKLSPMWENHAASDGQRAAVGAAEALDELREFVLDLPLVCHNAAFDKCVIENEIEKVSHRWKPRNEWICTLLMARSHRLGTFVGYLPGRDDGMSYKLEHVAKSLNLPLDPNQLHLGYYDAEVAGTVFLKMHHVRSVPISVYS